SRAPGAVAAVRQRHKRLRSGRQPVSAATGQGGFGLGARPVGSEHLRVAETPVVPPRGVRYWWRRRGRERWQRERRQ
ncbi:unnamed protein product, partial [Ectocarpus sp. 12 AP-2014]